MNFTMNNHSLMTSNYEPIDAETLLATPLPPVRWVIPGLLPAGLSLLAGASKAGKSWLCLWLCFQLAQGGTVWNRAVQPQTVLYLCLEDTLACIQSRLFRLTDATVPNRLFCQTQCGGIGDGLELQIEKFLHRHPETGLIVIDTLQKVRPVEQNVGAYASDYQDMSSLKSLADRHNIGLLLVHHLRKQGASDPFQQISGSNGLMGAADTIWLMQRQRMSDTARLLVTGRDMDSRTLHLQAENCVWQLLEEESAEEQAEKEIPAYLRQAADFVQNTGSWQGTATELLAAAGIADVQPNQFARKLVEYYYTVFAARGIRYESRRTANARQMRFWYDSNDGDDSADVIPRIAQTSSSPSSSSQGRAEMPFGGTAEMSLGNTAEMSLGNTAEMSLGNEHGLCVATGQPFAAADEAADTGLAPTPRRASVDGQPPAGRLLAHRQNPGRASIEKRPSGGRPSAPQSIPSGIPVKEQPPEGRRLTYRTCFGEVSGDRQPLEGQPLPHQTSISDTPEVFV